MFVRINSQLFFSYDIFCIILNFKWFSIACILILPLLQKSLSGNENGSELLPSGWSNSDTYSLRYIYGGDLYILRGVRADDTLIFNLLVNIVLKLSMILLFY